MPYLNLFWICPYYKWDERLCVHCEGGSKVTFPDKVTASKFYNAYCAAQTGWKQCTIAQSRTKYYEGKEAAET